MDGGDLINGNYVALFLDEEVHPLILEMNNIGYDVFTPGNHEFNLGMNYVKRIIKTLDADMLLSNVYNKDGSRVAKPYTILDRSGVKIAFIGVVTPNIKTWDEENLKDYLVTDPVEEVNKAVAEISDRADVIVVIAHMGEENELDVKNSGANDLASACEGIDLICAAHGHTEITDKKVNGCPIVENMNMCQTVIITDIELDKENDKWKINDITSKSIKTKDYKEDQDIMKLMEPYDKRVNENYEKSVLENKQ